MRKLLAESGEKKFSKILGVDPSSQKIACTLIEYGVPVATVKLDLKGGDIYERIHRARIYFPQVLEAYEPGFVCIEQSIMVQNPETSRKLSYVSGVLMGEVLVRDIFLRDVPPMTWKSFIGAKPLTKRWKEQIISELGETEGRKEIQRLKKSQVQDILKERYPNFSSIWEDNDVADSGGIGLWAYSVFGEGMAD